MRRHRPLRVTLALAALGATVGTVGTGGARALAAEPFPLPGAAEAALSTVAGLGDPSITGSAPPGGAPTTPPAAGTTAGRRAELVVSATAGIAPELSTVAVTSRLVGEAERAVRTGRADVDQAVADRASAKADLEQLQRDFDDLGRHRGALDAEQAARRQRQQAHQAVADERRARAEQLKDVLADLAAAAYMGVGADPPVLESPTVTDGARRTSYRRQLLELKGTERLAELAQQGTAQAAADTAAAEAATVEETAAGVEAARAANRAAAEAAERRLQEAAAREVSAREQLAWAEEELAEARRTAAVDGLDLPLVVLDALWTASRTMAVERPDCRLQWPLLAAISRVESGHGRFGASSVDRNGDVQPRILGPPLDGQRFALVPDSDGGGLDGDITVDRAVGPMQFIPSSWALFGRDGNGDGRGDPNSYYDAALAAAEHLCRAGADTATEAGLRTAVLGYNASEEYLRSVAGQALAYARFPLPG